MGAKRILSQKAKDKSKLYALHAPEVECLAKGKARTPYEFGVKVSITTTHKEGLAVGMRSMPSVFMWPIAGSIALRRLIIARNPRVTFISPLQILQ